MRCERCARDASAGQVLALADAAIPLCAVCYEECQHLVYSWIDAWLFALDADDLDGDGYDDAT